MLNGVAWSLLLPPLQSSTKPYVYYGQFLAETGKVPRPITGTVLSDEENAVINAQRLFDVAGNLDGHPPWTQLEDRGLDPRSPHRPRPRMSQRRRRGVGASRRLLRARRSRF